MAESFSSTYSLSSQKKRASKLLYELTAICLGTLFTVFCAQLRLPLYPVPVTGLTFAYCLLILVNPQRAFYSQLLYLTLASLGAPVLSYGASFSFWILKPTAGYLLALALGSLVSSYFLDEKSSWARKLAVLSGVSLGLLIFGATVLSLHFGPQVGFYNGFVPFLLTDSIKLFAALSISRLWSH